MTQEHLKFDVSDLELNSGLDSFYLWLELGLEDSLSSFFLKNWCVKYVFHLLKIMF